MKNTLDRKILILDGAMGTQLQERGLELGTNPNLLNLTHGAALTEIHRQYIEAGAEIICANTFSTNRFKLKGLGHGVAEVVSAGIAAAKAACTADTKVALDVGPLGELLEPMGELTFEDAYDAFKEVVIAGEQSGADLVFLETMTDLYEVKAAVLAAKENTQLPVFASMTFEETGRTFTGTSIEAMVTTLEGLGVDAIGINCSLGPDEIYPFAEELCSLTELPVLIKPNAGLPNPQDNTYNITATAFAESMKRYAPLGVSMVGGCCGTDPDFISKLKAAFSNWERQDKNLSKRESKVCSGTKVVTVDHVAIIGERINPTGKKRLKEALIQRDYDYIMTQATEQVGAGAEILDVNVGIPDIDDVAVLPQVVKRVQALTDLPLQIDSSNPEAIEAALRVYNGKAIVNSVNGEEKSLKTILPLVKKYGAAVVGLTLDDGGIPASAEGRFAIAERILNRAAALGIPKENVFIDCLTLAASAQQAEVRETLKAVRMVKERLGLHTVLGVSNISFGLPRRPLVNRTFLAMALENGLDLPIINPNDEEMVGTIDAFEMLCNRDKNAERFISRHSDIKQKEPEKKQSPELQDALIKGLRSDVVKSVEALLQSEKEMTIINDYLIPALDQVGKGFETGEIFLPQMMQAATAAQGGFEVIKEQLNQTGQSNLSKGQAVIATVQGDIHDIGKNIVKVIMENYGYDMIDLGRDVPIDTVVQTVLEKDIKAVGLSALMTTTLKSMEETIAAVRQVKPECKFFVGGAVLTAEYAKKIGADYYCRDAMKSVEAAKMIFGTK